MSLWKLHLDGFATQWMVLADSFEEGRKVQYFYCNTLKEAEALRFEWYAFKAKLRKAEVDLPYEQRMHPNLLRIRAEIGQMRDGRFALKMVLRDESRTSKIIEEALARTPEEEEAIAADFMPIQRKPK